MDFIMFMEKSCGFTSKELICFLALVLKRIPKPLNCNSYHSIDC